MEDPLPSPLADAHIEAQRRLRLMAAGVVGFAWRGLPGYDERNVDEFLSRVVPVMLTAQATSAALTEAYLAHAMGRQPLGIVPDRVTGAALRAGAAPEEVYRRPFVNVWSSLSKDNPWDQAVQAGLSRATSTAEMDVQLASRATFGEVGREDDAIFGFQRVADAGACEFCQEVDGAYIKDGDAMPLHNRCGCSLEPLDAPHPRARYLPDGSDAYDHGAVRVEPHGELGPLLVDPADHFTASVG